MPCAIVEPLANIQRHLHCIRSIELCTFTTGCREEILREEQIGERERGKIGSRDEERFCGENILRSMREDGAREVKCLKSNDNNSETQRKKT